MFNLHARVFRHYVSPRQYSSFAAFPTYKATTTWTSVTTQTNYLASLALWCDAAKTKLFTWQPEINPFFLGSPLWVIRAHSLFLHEQPHYHVRNDFQTQMNISSTPIRVGRVSLDMEHDIHDDSNGRKLATVCSTIIVVNEKGASIPWPERQKERMQVQCTNQPTITSLRHLSERPPPFKVDKYEFRTRPSDLDGIGHVNNARYFEFFQDARSFRELKAREAGGHQVIGESNALSAVCVSLPPVKQLYVEFVSASFADELLRIDHWCNHDETDPSICMEMTRNGSVLAKCIVREV